MDGLNDLKQYATLFLVLFVIMITVVVTYIGSDYLADAACELDGVRSYNDSACYTNVTANVEASLDTIDVITTIKAVFTLALSLLTLVVLMNILKLVIKAAKSFGAGGFN